MTSKKPVLTQIAADRWRCILDGSYVGHGKTATGALKSAKYFRARILAERAERVELARNALQHKQQLQKLTAELANVAKELESKEAICTHLAYQVDKIPLINDKWITERICHYNQACIEHIWRTKTLPTYDEYVEMKGGA